MEPHNRRTDHFVDHIRPVEKAADHSSVIRAGPESYHRVLTAGTGLASDPVGQDVSSWVVEEERRSCNRPADQAASREAGGKGTAGSAACVMDTAGSADCWVDIGRIRRPEAATNMDMWNLADCERVMRGLVLHSGSEMGGEDEIGSVARNWVDW